jgi:hypothetical protein
MPIKSRFRIVLISDHSNEKIVLVIYNDPYDLEKKLLAHKGKFKQWKLDDKLFIDGKEIHTYPKDTKFPSDSLIIICNKLENLVKNLEKKNNIDNLSSNNVVIQFLHNRTYVDPLAIKQLKHAAALSGMKICVGMPDLHPGGRFPVGAAFYGEKLYPDLVGQDIGCGMTLWKLNSNCDISDIQI